MGQLQSIFWKPNAPSEGRLDDADSETVDPDVVRDLGLPSGLSKKRRRPDTPQPKDKEQSCDSSCWSKFKRRFILGRRRMHSTETLEQPIIPEEMLHDEEEFEIIDLSKELENMNDHVSEENDKSCDVSEPGREMFVSGDGMKPLIQEEDVKRNQKLRSDMPVKDHGKVNEPIEVKPLVSYKDSYLDFPFLVEEKTISWIKKEKVMIILRGLSGSGKSTIVKSLLQVFPDGVVCSADNFFLSNEGVYEYDGSKIRDAHAYSQGLAQESCRSNKHTVIVDNTHVMRWEMKPYLNLAKKYGYLVILTEPKTPWKLDARVLAAKNSHNVPEKVLAKKVKSFEALCPLYYAWFFGIDSSKALLEFSKKLLLKCLSTIPEFRSDFERFSHLTNLEEMLEYFTRDMCKNSNREIVHCTAKFCGQNGCKKYSEKQVVIDSLGKVFNMSIIGFEISERTFGARVHLDKDELELWDQEDDKTRTEVIDESKSNKKEDNQNKKRNKKLTRKQKIEEDRIREMDGNKSTKDFDCDESSTNDDVSDRFYPIPGVGRRAHVTLGTAPGIPPVDTGFDLLDIVECEKKAKSGEIPFAQFTLDQDEDIVLRQYKSGLWAIYLAHNLQHEALFSGSY